MSKALIISGILVLLCETYGHTIPRNYIFKQEAGGWLKFYHNRLTWEEAVLKCYSEGAILASPLNANFSKAMGSVMCGARAFTGISNVYYSSEYQSMEGVSLSNICLSWPDSEEPDVNDTETNCIAMDTKGVATVVSCTQRLPFLCYRKDTREPNECGTADPEYVLDNRTGSCYKGYKQYLTWSAGYSRCAMDGAHLAVINSRTEAKVIYDLAKQLSPDYAIVSIGFRAWGNHSTWLTIHGQSLNETGYASWAPNEPNNLNGREFCGSLNVDNQIKFENGVLNDVECDHHWHGCRFICEIKRNINEATRNT